MPEKILVRATNWVGDVVMSTPALSAIKKNFPDSTVTVLVKPPLNELFQQNPAVDDVILYDRKRLYKGPTGLARLAWELRGRKFDRAILLQNAFEAALVSFLANIPVRMGYSTDGRGMLLTHPVKVKEETRKKHQVHYYIEMLSSLGLKADDPTPRLYLGATDEALADGLLAGFAGPDDLIVGVNPGAQYGEAKRWPPERFGAVADKLIAAHGARVVILGGPGDIGAASAVEASMKGRALNLAGKTSVRALMGVIGRLSLFITNDSGPMHVAAALGTPTVALFLSTDHIATGPFSQKAKVVREPVTCSPCLKRTCPDGSYACMEKVTADRVYNTALELMEETVGVPSRIP